MYGIHIYQAANGRTDTIRHRFLNIVAVRFFPRHGIEVVGVFTAPAEDKRLTYITRFTNDDTRKKALAAFAADAKGISIKVTSGDDYGYAEDRLHRALKHIGEWQIQIIKCLDTVQGFEVLSRRLVVARAFAWLGRSRGLAKAFEATIISAVAWALVAHISSPTRRLARA